MPKATGWLETQRMLMCKRVAGPWKSTSPQGLGYVLSKEES